MHPSFIINKPHFWTSAQHVWVKILAESLCALLCIYDYKLMRLLWKRLVQCVFWEIIINFLFHSAAEKQESVMSLFWVFVIWILIHLLQKKETEPFTSKTICAVVLSVYLNYLSDNVFIVQWYNKLWMLMTSHLWLRFSCQTPCWSTLPVISLIRGWLHSNWTRAEKQLSLSGVSEVSQWLVDPEYSPSAAVLLDV